jgi:hypothetical protein
MQEFNPQDIYRELVRLGEAWADANYAAELAEEVKKSLISQLATESPEAAISAREAFALRHPDFRKHIETMVGLRRAANKAKVRYDSAKSYAEMKRTQAANERAANRYAT